MSDPHRLVVMIQQGHPTRPVLTVKDWVIAMTCAVAIEAGKLSWHLAKAHGLV
ncbi:hypothetical protein [Streptomyces sp. NPDC051214]|uniref:hypothetical protein n=1 Tax=Streptomyces sp. NPDC051214 TaxID=3155282 RepID=UPI003424D1DB